VHIDPAGDLALAAARGSTARTRRSEIRAGSLRDLLKGPDQQLALSGIKAGCDLTKVSRWTA
jgi:hypothetical protein